MAVAVVAVGMVKHAVDQVVDMVAVGNGLVAAAGTVPVARTRAGMGGVDTAGGVGRADLQPVLVVMIDLAIDQVRVVEMAVVQIVHVSLMLDRGVSALLAVLVSVAMMAMTLVHER